MSEPIACTWAEWIEQRHLKRLEINHISGDHRPLPHRAILQLPAELITLPQPEDVTHRLQHRDLPLGCERRDVQPRLPRIGRDELLALYGCCDGFLSLQLEQLLLSHSRGPAAKIA